MAGWYDMQASHTKSLKVHVYEREIRALIPDFICLFTGWVIKDCTSTLEEWEYETEKSASEGKCLTWGTDL